MTTMRLSESLVARSRSMTYALRSVALCAFGLCSVMLCSVCGCGSGEEMFSVQGTVTYGTEAVAEGTITFEESTSRTTVQAALSPEGKYSVRVAPGKYKIIVEPPMVAETRGSDAGQTYKKVNNIPNNFRLAETTPLTATVDADAKLDFNLKK